MSASPPLKASAILLAGGSGTRMGNASQDKILLPLNQRPAILYSIDAFQASKLVSQIIIVYRDSTQQADIENTLGSNSPRLDWAQGGILRQDSVWSGLNAVAPDSEIVLIHDCARPLITPDTINAVARAAQNSKAACVARKTTDTIKQTRSGPSGYHLKTLDRSTLWSMETPQAFQRALITDAYRRIIETGTLITDDLSAIEPLDIPVALIENESPNPKITTPQDIAYIEFLLQSLTP